MNNSESFEKIKLSSPIINEELIKEKKKYLIFKEDTLEDQINTDRSSSRNYGGAIPTEGDIFVQQVERLLRENREIRTQNQQLKSRNTFLQTTNDQQVEELARARGELERLRFQNQNLQGENQQLQNAAKYWQQQAQRPRVESPRIPDRNIADPKGYFKALGIDPELAKTLPDQDFDKLLQGLRRLYTPILHPDRGRNDDRMKRLNEAFQYLSDATKRRGYGR